jgi:hypothetical protein
MFGGVSRIEGTFAVGLLAAVAYVCRGATHDRRPLTTSFAGGGAMWFHKLCVATSAVIVASACAHAQGLSISFHDPAFPSVHDIQWDTASPSPTMVIGIENPSSATDKLYGWQLGLRIVRDGGATGNLLFNAATLPPSYLLDGQV